MITYIVLICLLFVSVLNDLKASKICNIYLFFGVLIGLVLNVSFYGFVGLKNSIIGMTLPIFLLGIFFYVRLIGAGDIKLFCAIGTLLGGEFVMYSMAYTFIFAGIFAFICLARRSEIKSTFHAFYQGLKMCFLTCNPLNFLNRNTKHIIKLSPAIAMGAFLQILLCSF